MEAAKVIIQGVGVGGALIAGYIAIAKYYYEKNREIYIRRLEDVYAPLFALLAKQELIRRLYLNNLNREDYPILTTSKNVKSDGKINETPGIIDRNDFIKVLDDTSDGLARPKLLRLINEYKIILHFEENLSEDSDNWIVATREKVPIENQLVDEILDGYIHTLKKLGIDKKKIIEEERKIIKSD